MNTKTVFFNELKPFFKKMGYEFISGLAPKFILKKDGYVVQDGFNYLTKENKIYGGKLSLSINAIEDIILEIKFPNHDFSSYKNEDSPVFLTLGDRWGVLNVKDGELNSEEEIFNYANAVKQYIETDGQKFIERYSYLPNVLAEIDKLELEGKYWNELLAGGPEFLFRGLIISKLCSDEKYDIKLSYVESLLISMADDYLPYFEKLKIRLENLVPKYNI
jgi:hypothetical protein